MRKEVFWRIGILMVVALLFFGCSGSSDDDGASNLRLLRTEADNYNGNVLYTEYEYDSGGRMVTIKQHENSDSPEVAVTITYADDEIILRSFPKTEPLLNQTQEVRLSVDANGKVLKRIGNTYGVGKDPVANPGENFVNDTMIYSYDAAGFLKEIKQQSYLSYVREDYNRMNTLFLTTTYTTVSRNLTHSRKSWVYTYTATDNGVTSTSGGSSEHNTTFNYSKGYPNQTDFKNAAVLNEYLDYYDVFLDRNFENMPDQVLIDNVDKDGDGTVFFTANSTVEMDRTYNAEGLLAEVKILTANTQYRNFRYFYGR